MEPETSSAMPGSAIREAIPAGESRGTRPRWFSEEITRVLSDVYANGHSLTDDNSEALTRIAQMYVLVAATSKRPPFVLSAEDKASVPALARQMAMAEVNRLAPECSSRFPAVLDALDIHIVENEKKVHPLGSGWAAR